MTKQQPQVFTDRVRALTGGIMDRMGMILFRMGIHPDMITIVGLLIVLIGAVFIAQGRFTLGGVVLLIGLPLDAVDGAVARAMKRTDRFGAVLDSTLDRYADAVIFGALSYYFAQQDQFDMMVLALAALLGSYLVSYVRARAEGIDVVVKVGLFTRLERVAVILIMLLLPMLLEVGVMILAVGTNITGFQRLWFVYQTLKDREE